MKRDLLHLPALRLFKGLFKGWWIFSLESYDTPTEVNGLWKAKDAITWNTNITYNIETLIHVYIFFMNVLYATLCVSMCESLEKDTVQLLYWHSRLLSENTGGNTLYRSIPPGGHSWQLITHSKELYTADIWDRNCI